MLISVVLIVGSHLIASSPSHEHQPMTPHLGEGGGGGGFRVKMRVRARARARDEHGPDFSSHHVRPAYA